MCLSNQCARLTNKLDMEFFSNIKIFETTWKEIDERKNSEWLHKNVSVTQCVRFIIICQKKGFIHGGKSGPKIYDIVVFVF